MIWLFGSYARGDYINDRRVDEQGVVSEYNSDVDILVILHDRTPSKKSKITKKFVGMVENSPCLTSEFHVIYETLDRLIEGLEHSEYFYLDVAKEGVVLFNDGVQLNEPQHLPDGQQRRDMSIGYFEGLYGQSCDSQQTFEFHYQKGALNTAIFNLHQMTERLFYVYLLVHSHYKPRTHRLNELRDQVIPLSREIKSIFPFKTKEQRQLFGFFGDAYIDSRYKLNYEVDPNALDAIIGLVATFQQWVYNECLTKIDRFVPEDSYSQSQTLPYRFLDLDTLKTKPLPEVMVLQQERLLREQQVALEESLKREEHERQEKEHALNREIETQKQLEQEREEKALLLQKLRDAGLE